MSSRITAALARLTRMRASALNSSPGASRAEYGKMAMGAVGSENCRKAIRRRVARVRQRRRALLTSENA